MDPQITWLLNGIGVAFGTALIGFVPALFVAFLAFRKVKKEIESDTVPAYLDNEGFILIVAFFGLLFLGMALGFSTIDIYGMGC